MSEYLSMVGKIRGGWSVPKSKELWFRAEDTSHRGTRLQPGLYRARKSGIRKSVLRLLELENDLYDEFVRCATQLTDTKLSDAEWEWDSYFLMQHHGVPTRLLDWTDGALIALHFAVRNKEMQPERGSIIYVPDPYWLQKILRIHANRKDAIARWKKFWKDEKNRCNTCEDDWDRLYLPADADDARNPLLATPEVPMLWDLHHITRRVAAQRSRFMVFGTDPLWLSKVTKERDSRLVSIIVPAGAINRIRQELRDAGVTESVVYPDLDGLGRELKQIWKARR